MNLRTDCARFSLAVYLIPIQPLISLSVANKDCHLQIPFGAIGIRHLSTLSIRRADAHTPLHVNNHTASEATS